MDMHPFSSPARAHTHFPAPTWGSTMAMRGVRLWLATVNLLPCSSDSTAKGVTSDPVPLVVGMVIIVALRPKGGPAMSLQGR